MKLSKKIVRESEISNNIIVILLVLRLQNYFSKKIDIHLCFLLEHKQYENMYEIQTIFYIFFERSIESKYTG